MKAPTFPRYDTLIGRTLMRLLSGRKFTHREFQNETASYRLSSFIESLRNRHHWPIETKEETARTSDPVGRAATYGRYRIEPESLKWLRELLGERIDKFIEAVQRFEQGGGNRRPIPNNLGQAKVIIQEINALCAAGLALVPIPPLNGKPTKAPTAKGWNQRRSRSNPNGYSNNAADFTNLKGFNFGIYHGASNTLALDLDNVNQATSVFSDVAGLSLSDWLNDPRYCKIKSPKQNRGKLIFKLPVGFDVVGLKQLKHDGQVIFELRSGNCQDVVYGKHPDGGEYQLIGNPAAIPEAPAALLDMLQHWDAWKQCFESALGIAVEPSKIAPRKLQQAEHIPGRRDPIHEYNQANSVQAVLLANGYKQAGRDRFIRPDSESKAPGAVIMRNCADGIERVYSHGGDVLNDGYAHDAFDCFCLLECGGNFNKALTWNADITKHNQQIWREQQAQYDVLKSYDSTQEAELKTKPLFPWRPRRD
ncbi:MAG: bifunctional DNA primase/polymerase [Methylococcaceae bacterium]|nr:bifunctional DNA primase/polymerase [Methylococcaceae bacterium]